MFIVLIESGPLISDRRRGRLADGFRCAEVDESIQKEESGQSGNCFTSGLGGPMSCSKSRTHLTEPGRPREQVPRHWKGTT